MNVATITFEEAFKESIEEIWNHPDYVTDSRIGDIREPQQGEDFFFFDYDWRKDVAENAVLLAGYMENIKKVRGSPDLRFDMISHSSGHLIARYYALHGGKDVLETFAGEPTYEGAKNLRKLYQEPFEFFANRLL